MGHVLFLTNSVLVEEEKLVRHVVPHETLDVLLGGVEYNHDHSEPGFTICERWG